jgi:hypothetical protein
VGNLHASVSLKGITEFKMADRNFYTYMHVLCPESENAIVTVPFIDAHIRQIADGYLVI